MASNFQLLPSALLITSRSVCFAALLMLLTVPAHADTAYFQRTFFDNSLTGESYFYSKGKPSSPSTLDLVGDKLPVDTRTFSTPPNSLRLQWTSKPQGGWEAEVLLYEWRNRDVYFPGDTLFFWCYAPEAIQPADLPRLVLRDKNRNFTHPIDLAPFVKAIPGRQWVQIRIPLDRFISASVHAFDPHRVNAICFVQGLPDGVEHTLLLDEFRFDTIAAIQRKAPLAPPRNLEAKGYERHIDIRWSPGSGEQPERYIIYRSLNGAQFQAVGIQVRGVNRYADFIGNPDQKAAYKVKASDRNYRESAFSLPASASTHPMTDDELLTMVQEACFRYSWEGAHPVSGMIRENLPGDDDIVATGATGFGIMALVVGVERGFITRQQGLDRLLKITSFLEHADRFHGAWPHFTNGATGRRMPVFDMFDNGADLVETSFLMEGLLTARQYFKPTEQSRDREGAVAAQSRDREGASSILPERALYNRITRLWNGVEWDWFRRTATGDALFWHWSPEYSWYINHRLYGWNEVMITYLLSIASPTHAVPPSLYYTGWAGDPKEFLNRHTYFGIKLDLGTGTGGPLFFTHYSYMGFDPHGIRDRFTDYFQNNRSMALINNAYCVKNPGHYQGYGPQCWGLTAVDGPKGYVPYEPEPELDDGTIAPTGAIASFPYTPDLSMQALKFFYRELGDRLWGIYGFRDALNLQQNWFSSINMGLNQAPMVVMIENFRSGLIWKNFMTNPEIRPMLNRIGFHTDSDFSYLLSVPELHLKWKFTQ